LIIASHWFPYVKKRILVIYETPIDLNPLETAIDELKQKIDDLENILKKKDLTLLELYLQGGIMPQVHKGPLAYAEAFLEPTESNMKYSKECKKNFKHVFKKLIDLYQNGIDMYAQLALRINQNQHLSLNEEKTSQAVTNSSNTNNASSDINKYVEMHRMLKEKFNEFENSFRNLLLIDGVSSF
jgi:hypothetical protein